MTRKRKLHAAMRGKASEEMWRMRTGRCRGGERVWDWRMSALRCMEPISSPWCNDTKTQAPCRHAGGESSGYTLGTKPAVVSLRRRHGAQGFAAAAGDRFWNSGGKTLGPVPPAQGDHSRFRAQNVSRQIGKAHVRTPVT